MYNYIISNRYTYPIANPTFFANGISIYPTNQTLTGYPFISPVNLIVPTPSIDGEICNARNVTISLGAAYEDNFNVVLVGFNVFGQPITEEITIVAGDTIVQSVNAYTGLNGVYAANFVAIPSFSIGFAAKGQTAIALSNGAKSSHFVTLSADTGGTRYTIEGSVLSDINSKTTAAEFNPFPLDASLVNLTTSMTSPFYYQQSVNYFYLYIETQDAEITYTINLQSLIN